MPSLRTALATLAIALVTSGNAHMLMASPQAYGSPSKSPLAADGSDFPCKATSNAGAAVTDMSIGQEQILSFNGTAVHGGGSCQISLTKDSPATKSSKWMVIHSIEGGCPARNTAGNLAEGANPDTTKDPDTYKYTIPQGIAPGAYTLGWTWFNKVGNREMYMNCASIKVSGGSGKRDTPINQRRAAASFPSMFVANIGDGCTTAEGGDLKFPEPGTSVETNQGYIPKAPVGSCGGASGGSSSSGSDTSGASSGNTQGETSTTPSMAAAAPVVPASSSVAVTSPAPADTKSTSAATGGSASGSGSAPSSDKPSAGGSTSSCSSPGQSICSPDGTQIGTCSQGNTVTWIKLSSGTKCSNGNVVAEKRSEKRNVNRSTRRSARFAGEYIYVARF